MRSIAFVFASLVSITQITRIAEAQPGALPQSYVRERVGLELGAGLQAGEIQCRSEGDRCDEFTEAGGLNLNAAYFLGPKLGITLDLWGMTHRHDDFTFTHYVNTVGIKLRPLRILTLTAGLGTAHASLDYHGSIVAARATSENAFAIMGSAAVDLIRAPRWAFSVEARFGTGFYGDDDDDGMADVVGRNVGIGAGLTFFGF